MKFKDDPLPISGDSREGNNARALELIHDRKNGTATPDQIHRLFTGKGGLHGLHFEEYGSYYEFSEAKKEKELGQFFTPDALCADIIQCLQPPAQFKIADLTCGKGSFFNCLDAQEARLFGNELDPDAHAVCRYLYPKAHITLGDFAYFHSDERFDLVIGNPPFNIRTRHGISQYAYLVKAEEHLQFGGILAVIVPATFLADDFQNTHKIEWVNEHFNFIAQAFLPEDAFSVHISTKLLFLQKKGVTNSDKPYTPSESVSFAPPLIYSQLIGPLHNQYQLDRPKIRLMQVKTAALGTASQYNLNRRLYHIYSSPVLRRKYHAIALAKLAKLKSQRKPDKITDEEWEKVRLTPQKILSWMNRMVKAQNAPPPRKIVKIVKTAYGLRNKAYCKSLQVQGWTKSVHTLLLTGERFAPYQKLYDRKQKVLTRQNMPWAKMPRDAKMDALLDQFTLTPVCPPGMLFPLDGPEIHLNAMQKKDLGLMLQKDYGILAWEMGGGKSVAGMAFLRYRQGIFKNAFLLAPALAIETTWTERLTLYGFDFIQVESISDLSKVRPGQLIILTNDALVKLQRHVKAFVKRRSYKIALLVDESDELTNENSQRTQATLNCFRKAKYKLLTTGTTTRNNINELYAQLELVYNNSTAFTCWAEAVYYMDEENNLCERYNDHVGMPFPAYRRGAALFKASFCPQKSTVFGIKKDGQDVYNAAHLKEIIDKTIITRKFEEIVGEKKYSIHTHQTHQTPEERDLYKLILQEFLKICYTYYTSTGNARKEAALRLIRQIKLLIRATSTPHLLRHYKGQSVPGKYKSICDLVASWEQELVTVGVTFREAGRDYAAYLGQQFPRRPIFYIDGSMSITVRKKILLAFKVSRNGILVCTQQSLKSSVNIPYCNKVIIEALQWNIPKISQFYFRFIRFDSLRHTQVHFVNYEQSIELNLLALLMKKEQLNDFIKTTNESTSQAIYAEYGIDLGILDSMIRKSYDNEGHLHLSWGNGHIY